MKKIDLENHFASETYVDALYNNPGYPRYVDDGTTAAGLGFASD